MRNNIDKIITFATSPVFEEVQKKFNMDEYNSWNVFKKEKMLMIIYLQNLPKRALLENPFNLYFKFHKTIQKRLQIIFKGFLENT